MMEKYHKINTVFKRDMETKYKKLLVGQFATPEFEYLANNDWIFTEKVNGTNIRVMVHDGIVTFGGKDDNSQIPAKLVNRLNELFLPKAEKLNSMFEDGACLYFEGYGAGIQKGGENYSKTQEVVLFDINVGGWWLQRVDLEIIAKEFVLDIVPIAMVGTLHEAIETVRIGFFSQWGNFDAEGLVGHPIVELKARNGDRVITKIKHVDFVNLNG